MANALNSRRGGNPRFHAVLKTLAAWREREAQARDIPRNRVIRDETLLDIAAHPMVLKRTRRTPPLKGMSALQRRKTVAGAFEVADKAAVVGKTIILVDDVLTTGSTAEACARALKRAGAARVELVSWARVVKPSQLMR